MTTTGTVCGSCGAEPLENARFCHRCGSPVAEAETHAEYKQVTVLFADVVRSMDIAAAVGAERLREIMVELVTRASVVVQRYGGTVDKFTGDGIMAVFGAPVALEDHAVRACLAALGIQEEAKRLAEEVQDRDGVDLQLRVGLNSGQVIAGEIGSGPFGYTAVGEHVGMAQRMESVAPGGGVMLSESTARLVDHAAELGEPEFVRIKGTDEPVCVRRLVAVAVQPAQSGRFDTTLVGRQWELNTVAAMLDRSVSGQGCVVGVAGPAGIGKSRLVYETAAMARGRGINVFSTFCESHASDVPFHVAARLLGDAAGITDVDDEAARTQVRARVADASDEDVLLLHDLLGIRDPDVALPNIDPDARRRRLTALINSMSLARTEPAVYVIEDAHWIDAVSESMFADFLAVIPQTHSVVLITYRPEYRGALAQVPGAQTISLAPLTDSETTALLDELLGTDPSVAAVRALIAGRAAGNPFFAEEIVRELAERNVLEGERGGYTCHTEAAGVAVPATLQATIAARIDRLEPRAKRTLNAAAVIGSRFDTDLLTTLGVDPVLDDLIKAELIDQVKFTPHAVYAFHHPLIRTVAYDAQLKSDRAELHGRLAKAIQDRDQEALDQNAALIAEHLEAAGDLHRAYGWHMRAGGWSTNRDVAAAWLSWERARRVADALPADDADRTAMRIAPRSMLCSMTWRVRAGSCGPRFEELRQLCAAAGDKASLAIGMAGLIMEHAMGGRVHEASRLASEQMELVESIGDPTLTIGLSCVAIIAKHLGAEMADVLRWSQTVIDLADGDPAKGNFMIGSPLAWALATRGVARWVMGRAGWREDFEQSVAMARSTDPVTHAYVVNATYGLAIPYGVLLADDVALRIIDEAVQNAERCADDAALVCAGAALGQALVYRESPADRERGLAVLGRVRGLSLHEQFSLGFLPYLDVYAARERARSGDRDGAVSLLRAAADDSLNSGALGVFTLATRVLLETLLDRGDEDDLAEAKATIDGLAAVVAIGPFATSDVFVLPLQALLARALGDEAAYRDYRDRYRAMATELGFEGHMKWAEAMP